MKKKFSQKGISLFLAVIILTIILTIVLGLSTILIGQIKMIRGMGNSVVALYAADTGIEQVLKIVINDGQDPDPRYPDVEETGLDNEASYWVRVFCCHHSNDKCDFWSGAEEPEDYPAGLEGRTDCLATRYCVRSVGTFNEVQRAIEVKIYPTD